MRKILIIGAGVEQVSAIVKAKELGFYVITSDYNENAPGVKYADKFHNVSTTDVKGNVEVGRKERIDGVCTICSETAVPTVAKVAAALGLNSFSEDTALKATNKGAMRQAFKNYAVKVSPNIVCDTYEQFKRYSTVNKGPWVFKPVDSSGQRGTHVVDAEGDRARLKFQDALIASPSKKVLIDRKIEGYEIHVTMLLLNEELIFLAISDRVTLDDSHFGIAVRHIGPSNLDADLLLKVKEQCRKAVQAIGLQGGVCTCELLIEGSETFMMETAIRVPGGYLREVAMSLSGVDIVEATILHALNVKYSLASIQRHQVYNAITAYFITKLNLPKAVRTITSFELMDRQNLLMSNLHFEYPFVIEDLKSSVGRFAVIICYGKSLKEAIESVDNVWRNIKVNKEYSLHDYSNYNRNNRNWKTFTS
jgi:biotin carboxylase